MPYTKEQLKNVDFYQDFVTELQTEYLDRVEELKQEDFRRNGVLYSFEDITTRLGIEDGIFRDNSDYSTLAAELNRAEIEGITEYTDFKDLIEKRVEIVHQKLVDQNNESKVIKDFKLLVEKRVELTHKKLIQQKINQ